MTATITSGAMVRWSVVLLDQSAEKHSDYGNHDCAQHGGSEAGQLEPGCERGRQVQHRTVHAQIEQAMRIACVSVASIPGTSFTAAYRAAALTSHLRMSFTS